VRATLAVEGVASAGQLQQLLRTTTEALADVRAAQIVPAPESRDLSNAVPGATGVGAAYEVTETERAKATNVLINLLFTVVETPTHDDRRRAGGAGVRGGDRGSANDADGDRGSASDADGGTGSASDADGGTGSASDADGEESPEFGVTGYAGPE
jgi:hypothetical protein